MRFFFDYRTKNKMLHSINKRIIVDSKKNIDNEEDNIFLVAFSKTKNLTTITNICENVKMITSIVKIVAIDPLSIATKRSRLSFARSFLYFTFLICAVFTKDILTEINRKEISLKFILYGFFLITISFSSYTMNIFLSSPDHMIKRKMIRVTLFSQIFHFSAAAVYVFIFLPLTVMTLPWEDKVITFFSIILSLIIFIVSGRHFFLDRILLGKYIGNSHLSFAVLRFFAYFLFFYTIKKIT